MVSKIVLGLEIFIETYYAKKRKIMLAICVTHLLFYTLGVAAHSTPIAKLSRIIQQIFSISVTGLFSNMVNLVQYFNDYFC
jgi:hypothetical protein